MVKGKASRGHAFNQGSLRGTQLDPDGTTTSTPPLLYKGSKLFDKEGCVGGLHGTGINDYAIVGAGLPADRPSLQRR